MALLRKPGNKLARYEGELLRDTEGTDCCCSQFCCDGEIQCPNAQESFIGYNWCDTDPDESIYTTFVQWFISDSGSGTCFFRFDFVPAGSIVTPYGSAVGAYEGFEQCSDIEGDYRWTGVPITFPTTPTFPGPKYFNADLPPVSLCDFEDAVFNVKLVGRGIQLTVSGITSSVFDPDCASCDDMNGVYLIECGDILIDAPEAPGPLPE